MKWTGLPAALLFLAGALTAAAQMIEVNAQTQRTNFLLYERVDVLVTLTNVGGTDLVLDNNEGQPWLNFQVMGEKMREVFLPVHAERRSNFAPLTLKANETKTLRVNITPLFSFRSEGNYRASAVIDLPGAGQIVSDPVPFTIQRGRTVASDLRTVDSVERTYSLIRFSPDSQTTNLYLRVEAPSENTVYANYALGPLASSVDPALLFDPQGDVHIMQPTAMGTYLYSRTDPDGKILDQRIFKVIQWQPRPRLVKLADGNVIVQGGLSEDTTPREKLSDTQKGEKVEGPAAPQNVAAPSDGGAGAPPSGP